MPRKVHLIVGGDVVGVMNRTSLPESGHPMIREDWGTEDNFRGAMGYYRTPLSTYATTGQNRVITRLDNYSETPDGFLQNPANAGSLSPEEYSNRLRPFTLVDGSLEWKLDNVRDWFDPERDFLRDNFSCVLRNGNVDFSAVSSHPVFSSGPTLALR